jgi:hypothetical protein
VVFRAFRRDHVCRRDEEEDMYQELMRDVYKQWLDEFDHEAAFKRNQPRRDHESRVRSGFARLRGRA